jgi:hypothetical protein
MKSYRPITSSAFLFFIGLAIGASSARADISFGMGAGKPRDSVFDSGMLSLYADYTHPTKTPFTWRAGLDWTYATRPFDGYAPDVTYKGFGGRAAALWFPATADAAGHGFYVGAGPTALHYTLRRETPGSGAGGSGIVYRGTGGLSNLIALLYNQITGTFIPDKVVTSSHSAFGGHGVVGYRGKFWHIEALYEVAAADLIKPGGAQVRFGFSF